MVVPLKRTILLTQRYLLSKDSFNWLWVHGWVEQVPAILPAPHEAADDLRRDYLTSDEWKRMIPTLNAWRKEKGITDRQA